MVGSFCTDLQLHLETSDNVLSGVNYIIMRRTGLALTTVALCMLPGETPVDSSYATTCSADVRNAEDNRLVSVPGSIGAQVCAATIIANDRWNRKGLPDAASAPVVYYATLETARIMPPLPDWDTKLLPQKSYSLPR